MSVSKELQKIIKENRPNISVKSMNTYMSCLRNIARGTGLDFETVDDYTKHYDEIMKYLMTMKPNIRKTKLATIVNVLNSKGEHSEIVKECLVKYRKQMNEDARKVEDEYEDQELTESQKENYIPWDEVLKTYNELKKDTKNLWKKETLNPTQFKLLQQFVLLSCYVLIPTRRSQDFADFKIRNFDDKSKDSVDNYMEIPKNKSKKAQFVFNSYKNSKRLGTQYVTIPNELKKIIKDWTKINPYDYLIVNSHHNKVTQSKIYDILVEIFGKRIGTSLLRHIFITGKFGEINLKDLDSTTHDMGNSEVTRTLKYVQKDSEKLDKKDEKEEK